MKKILTFLCLCAVPLTAQASHSVLEKAIETQVKKADAASAAQSASGQKAAAEKKAQEKEFSAFIKDLKALPAAKFMQKYSIYHKYGPEHFHYYSSNTGKYNARLHRFLKEEFEKAGTYQKLARQYKENDYMLAVVAEMYLREKGLSNTFLDYQYRLFSMGFQDGSLNADRLRGQVLAAEALSSFMPDYINELNQELTYNTREQTRILQAAEPLFKFYEMAVNADTSSFLYQNRRYIQDSVVNVMTDVLNSGNEKRVSYYLKLANPLVKYFTFDETSGHVSGRTLADAFTRNREKVSVYNRQMSDLRVELVKKGLLEAQPSNKTDETYLKGMRSIL